MFHLSISPGWIFLIGGVVGLFNVSCAKTFAWKGSEFLTSEEDRKREVPMTPARRWSLIALYVGLTVWGAIWVQRDHNWNLFAPRGGSVVQSLNVGK